MADTKYGNLVQTEPIQRWHGVDSISSAWDILKAPAIINYHIMIAPMDMVDKPHTHPFYEFLCFIGGNASDIRDFGGEVELCLGAEKEKHIINKTTIVTIPPGVPHCPLNFKVVTKPFIFLVFGETGLYTMFEQGADGQFSEHFLADGKTRVGKLGKF
jgi:hypothetical protein